MTPSLTAAHTLQVFISFKRGLEVIIILIGRSFPARDECSLRGVIPHTYDGFVPSHLSPVNKSSI